MVDDESQIRTSQNLADSAKASRNKLICLRCGKDWNMRRDEGIPHVSIVHERTLQILWFLLKSSHGKLDAMRCDCKSQKIGDTFIVKR